MNKKQLSETTDMALRNWRNKRDKLLKEAGIDRAELYRSGKFDELPYEIAMAVHYVDAFACVRGWIDEE
jgi:hypothetical protein